MSDAWGFLPGDRGSIQKCFECGDLTTGRHHVVPRSKGGTKVLPLCVRCHEIVHGDGGVFRADLIRLGIQRKRSAGWQPGRPRKVTEDATRRALQLRRDGATIKAIALELGLSTGIIHKITSSPRVHDSTITR